MNEANYIFELKLISIELFKKFSIMISKNWIQVYQTQIQSDYKDDIYHINIRVSTTPDCYGVITDIRRHIGKKGTKLGGGLFIDEIEWFYENVRNKSFCEKEFDSRKIRIIHENNNAVVTVIKSDLSEQKMYLSDRQVDYLFCLKGEIMDAIN